MTIDKQRLGESIPDVTLSTVKAYPLLPNEALNISAATNNHAITEELLEMVTYIRSSRSYRGRTREKAQCSSEVVIELRQENEN
jgi:hypothetical protein